MMSVGFGDVVYRRHALGAGDGDAIHLGAGEAVFGLQLQHRLHRGVRRHVHGEALQAQFQRGVVGAEFARQVGHVPFGAEHFQESGLAFEHAARAGEAVGGKAGGHHAAFGRAAQVQALHHRAGARAGEFHQAAGERAGDAEGVGHLLRVEPQQHAGRDGGAEGTGGAGGVEAAALVAVFRCITDAVHHLESGDEGGDQLAAAVAAVLRDGQRGRQQGGAGMHAGAGLGQVVGFEGVRERTVGERGGGGLHGRSVGAEDAAASARADALCVGRDDTAPGQAVA